MKKAIVICSMFLILAVSGCALANKIAPSQLDTQGNPIPGTHDVSQGVHTTASTIPYAEPIIGILLLAWNFVERTRANMNGKGLVATVQAIEQAGNDPATSDAIAKLKQDLANAHQIAGVTPLINDILAKKT